MRLSRSSELLIQFRTLEITGSSVLDFGDEGFFGYWTLKTTGIGALYFGLVSVRSFTLDPVSIGIGWDLWIGIGCDLWKPVVSISIGIKLGPLETKPVVYGFLVLSELNFKGQQLFG
ncbi:unnamed protein product [Rhizophagus irregularis]|nr:unnamed protein product [Rhizophagus irregularis]